MPIINVEQGEVYEFTTVGGTSTVISQFAGTSDVFNKDVYGQTVYSGSAAQLLINPDATLRVQGAISIKRSPLSIDWYPVQTNTGPKTSSYEFETNYLFTGSFLKTRGTNDHLIIFGTPTAISLPDAARPNIQIIRNDANTSKITISGSAGGLSGPFYFNGTETLSGSFSCTDPFCSIEITAPDSIRWMVTNAIGNWTSP